MEKQPKTLGETEDPEVLQATHVWETHVRTTAPLLGRERSWVRLVFVLAPTDTDDTGQDHCSFVICKARVTPLKPVTIPRLEPTVALLSVRVSTSLWEELEYDQITEVFYTDSQVVLDYIKNDARRFHVFVANWVQKIRENSTPDQWKYIETKENPADESSRGLPPQDLVNNSRWLSRPSFLRERELPYRNEEVNIDISQDDSEVKKYKFSPLNLTQKGWQPSPNAWSTSSIGTEPRELLLHARNS